MDESVTQNIFRALSVQLYSLEIDAARMKIESQVSQKMFSVHDR